MKPSADTIRLIKCGWKSIRRKKMGCMVICDWQSPHDGQIYRQSQAIEIEVQNRARRRMALEQNSWVRKG